jgi:dephospho-CoA kinase
VPALGITGGIGTGKSAFSAALRQYLPMEIFDADRCGHELLAEDPNVQREVAAAFGGQVFDANGKPDRARLREIVFTDAVKRRTLEQILHPAIRARWTEMAQDAARGDHWFGADIPLLYETNAQSYFNAIVVVACSPATQRTRLLQLRHLANETDEKIISTQFDLATKIAQADYLIWNDSSLSSLDRQARFLAGALQRHASGV